MSTAVPPQAPPSTPTPGATSPSSAPATGVGSPAPEPYRIPDTDPRVWARGKTVEEVLGLAEQAAKAVQSYVETGRPAPAPAQPAPAYQPPAPPPQVGDDDYLTGGQFRQLAQQYQQQTAQDARRAIELAASANLESIKRDNSGTFQKYGPEVYNKLANVDKQYWTVDNLRTIVNLVKADHVEELAAERAQSLFNEQTLTLRSTGAPLAPVSSPQDSISEDLRKRLDSVGIDLRTLDQFCLSNGLTREQWIEAYGKTAITEGTRRS